MCFTVIQIVEEMPDEATYHLQRSLQTSILLVTCRHSDAVSTIFVDAVRHEFIFCPDMANDPWRRYCPSQVYSLGVLQGGRFGIHLSTAGTESQGESSDSDGSAAS